MSGAIPPLPNTPSWGGAQLKKHRDTFTFTFTLSLQLSRKISLHKATIYCEFSKGSVRFTNVKLNICF